MDRASNSFKSYSMVDDQAEDAFRQKTRKRLIIILISIVVLIGIIVGALAGVLVPINNKKSKAPDGSSISTSSAESIVAMCNFTRYPDSCNSSMSSALQASSNGNPNPTLKPQELFLLSLKIAEDELQRVSSVLPKIINKGNAPLLQSALQVCETLFADAVDNIKESISSVQIGQRDNIDDLRTWLSTALTDQETCIDALKETNKTQIITEEVRYATRNSTMFISNSLAIATNILAILDDLEIHRKLLTVTDDGELPEWVQMRDRRLLKEGKNKKPDITVAKDGSGDFKSINEAMNSIPRKSNRRFVIYVKEGLYEGNVTVGKDYWNVMIYGDGMNKTIISAGLNVADGVGTYSSGSLAVDGKGFIAKDMGFKNTAGPKKGQAVAVRSSSDKSIFYRCSFDAFQDTLYTHSNRQFYRDCQITGTVDFIFGNSAVVFQNCTIQPRQPSPKQFNTVTAQGKSDPNQNTGISIQRCTMIPFDNLTATTYYGRPWRDYATTVIMQSYIGELLDPTGWASWDADVSTVYYGEFQNDGAGSDIDRRVDWPGVRPNITVDEAEKFTVENFIHGNKWLSQANVVYDATL